MRKQLAQSRAGRLLAVVAVLGLAVVLAACGGSYGGNGTTNSTQGSGSGY
jgi:hypothetical protein